jgi:hypothetical protein
MFCRKNGGQVASFALRDASDYRHNSGNWIIPATHDQPRYFLENREAART